MMGTDEWHNVGYTRNKNTGRWHAIIKIDGDTHVSEKSWATREEVIDILKRWAESINCEYRPLQ
jgi:hypothetical protein